MNTEEVNKVKSLLNKPKRVIIVTHKSPDGDAIGSSLGLYNLLLKKGHQVTVIVPNEYPAFLHWLPGDEKVVNYEKQTEQAKKLIADAELIFCLDFNTLKRIDEVGVEVEKAKAIKFLIDHHPQPDDFADYKFHFTTACSTAELIFEFVELTGDKKLLDAESGICLYTGIMTDTASFRFPSVSAKTHRIAAELIEMGVKFWHAHENVYDSNTEDRLRMLGFSLSEKMKILKEYNTAYITLSKSELDRFNFQAGDTEGLVNYCLSIDGIKMAAFFMEKDGTIKTSFRSKGSIDVNAFARANFNGGGHKNAAGGSFSGTMEEAIKKFRSALPEYKSALTGK